MWILVRLVLAVAAFLLRQWYRASPPTPDGYLDNITYFIKLNKKRGRIRSFRIGMPLRAPYFRIHEEKAIDRFFKRLGVAMEAQTGDSAFDGRFYITGDHPFLFDCLRDQSIAREKINAVFSAGFERITGDGTTLWLDHPAEREPTQPELELLGGLRLSLSILEKRHSYSVVKDRFFWKALIVEAVVWSIVAYAIGGLIEYQTHKEDYHLNSNKVFLYGLVAAVFLFASLFGMIVLFLRGSSRGHRILIESAWLLAIGLPIAGIQLVSDLNRGMDHASPVSITRTIQSVEMREHKGRRGRTWYTYHVHLAEQDQFESFSVPDEIEVSTKIFERAKTGQAIELQIGPGRLGLPWYRNMVIRDLPRQQ